MKTTPDPRLKKWRKRFGVYDNAQGPEGAFIIPFDGATRLCVIASTGGDWEHVSVSPLRKQRTPTWEEMAFVKDIFWSEEETVIQIHPPKAIYVNNHSFVLHLWRPTGATIPLPPPVMVGILGMKAEEAEREALRRMNWKKLTAKGTF